MRLLVYISVVIVTFAANSAANPNHTAAASEVLAIHDVHVLTMEDEEIKRNYTVIVRDGRIDRMGPANDIEIPENAQMITGELYLMPGLAEMHGHIPGPDQHMDPEETLRMYLAQGITTVRGMLGQPLHLELREKADESSISSPRIITSGPGFSGQSVDSPEQGRQMVREQHDAGYDLLKFHPGLTLEEFEAITGKAHELDMEFSGHISFDVGLERSLDAGKGTIDHLDRYMEFIADAPEGREDPPVIYFGYDLTDHVVDERIREAARITREAGVWNVPTNTLLHNVLNPDLSVETMQEWPGMSFLPEEMVENWSEFVTDLREGEMYDPDRARRFLEIRDRITLALHEEGAGIMLGADAPQIFNPPGFSAHRELALYVDAGLSPFEALKTGTVNVARYLNEEGKSGKVAPGYRADLILLTENPLESIPFHDHLHTVISEGVPYSADALLESLR